MRYQSSLTTVEAVARQLAKADPGQVITPDSDQYDDFFDYLSDIVPEVGDFIATQCGMSFVPYREDKIMYFRDIAYNKLFEAKRRLLWLPDELMVVNSIVWDITTLAATDYRMHPTDSYTAWALLFNSQTALNFSSDFNAGITISGTWGFALNPTQMYTTVETVTLANDTVTTIDVADANAYETFQYVRCESELMQVVNRTVNDAPTSDTITVLRGVNGHTAAAHSAKALQIFKPVRGIELAAKRMCAYLWQKRTDVGGSVQIGDAAFLLDSLPAIVKNVIEQRSAMPIGNP